MANGKPQEKPQEKQKRSVRETLEQTPEGKLVGRLAKLLGRSVGEQGRVPDRSRQRNVGEPSATLPPVPGEFAPRQYAEGHVPAAPADATAVRHVGNERGTPFAPLEDPVEKLARTLGKASYEPRSVPAEVEARKIWEREGPVPNGLDPVHLESGGIDEGAVWRAVEPYARHFQIPVELAAQVGFSAATENIPLNIAFRLIERESSYNPDLVSEVGAHGYTQMTPIALAELHRLGLAPPGLTYPDMVRDPQLTMDMGFRYLAHLKDRYGDWQTALTKYSGNADRYHERVMGTPK